MQRTIGVFLWLALFSAVHHYFGIAQDYETGDKISLKVSAAVSKTSSDRLLYKYALQSLPASKQNVWQFRVIFSFESASIDRIESPAKWPDPMTRVEGLPNWVGWCALGENKLKPGASESGFGFQTVMIPGITDYYAEGYARPPSYDDYVTDDTLHGYDDLTPYGPGVVGRTVGPVPPPNPFDPVGFLDTLLSYTAQAASLGWITGQTTTDKYIGYFTSGKTSLQNSNVSAARTTLRQVLQDVNVDSTSTLTSEAYALLRYNTEYLLSKLPAPPAITALNPSMSIVGSSAFTLTVSGTNFEGGSGVNWNGSGRTTTFIADTVLRASIHAADVAVVGSPAVTVRNADGSESDAVRFYVISAVAWVDTVISYKHKALSLGWIDDAGVANSLDQKLDNARKQLEQGNNKAAKNILEAFVNEVEAQKGKHLSNEAYGLLKPRAEFLISKL